MEEQDRSLEDMARTVQSTKQIASAIHGELDLQVRLLDDIEDEVQVTRSRLAATGQRIASVVRTSWGCMSMCSVALLIAGLVALIVLLVKHS